VNAADKAGNTATQSVSYSVQYAFFGFLPPLSLLKDFKVGSAIPIIFWLTDGCWHFIGNARAEIWLQQYSGDQPVGALIPGKAKGQSASGNLFKYNKTLKAYHFNLDTKDLALGEWQIIVRLDDGTEETAFIELFSKKKKK